MPGPFNPPQPQGSGVFPHWPYPDPSQVQAPLLPPDQMWYASQPGIVYMRTPLDYPNPWLAYSQQGNLAHPPRDRIVALTNGALDTESLQRVTFDHGSAGHILFLAATCNTTDRSAFPVGWTPLTAFSVSIELAQREKLITQAGIAEAIFGTGAFPRKVVGDAWPIDVGTTMVVGITPHLANLRITLNFMCVQTRGPTNVGSV